MVLGHTHLVNSPSPIQVQEWSLLWAQSGRASIQALLFFQDWLLIL